MVGRLELIVELLTDPFADLLGDRAGVDPGRDHVQQLQAKAQILHIGMDRLGDAGVLDLDGDRTPIVQHGPVHLADGGGGNRLGVEIGEGVAERTLQVGTQHLFDRLERDWLGVVLERGEDLLKLRADLLRHEPQVDSGERLADLHRGAAHAAEHLDELLGRLELLA
jgi:hypothetical protein